MIPASNTSFLFWKDRWCGTLTLQERFPRLYSLEKKKLCTINDRIKTDSFNWCWKVQQMEDDVLSDFISLCSLISDTNTLPVVNCFRFKLSIDGKYMVHSLQKYLDAKNAILQSGAQINWSKAVPLKIRCFIWRALLDHILVAANLEIRGIKLQSATCPLCNLEKETGDHLLINCSVAREARGWIFNWCGIKVTQFNNVIDFVNFAANWGSCPTKRERMNAIVYGLLWFVWMARNNKVFKQTRVTPAKIADEVISQTYTWFKYRTQGVKARWIDWSLSPFC
ncbi:uncharacterized protein LOC111877898 [Lactuca sativa]|uniref:uncharacterized protein LOC111877898 n=1 Tax=Lactuca sativa TaxID=4236 RepID=UPI000CD8C9BC|nr:uncharacterized protein LOC111877898 [Lactuca sativa]